MKWNLLVIAILVAAALSTSCEPNEISLFIEHVKALPEAPSCVYSVSDDFISGETMDLAVASGASNAYLAKNQLMAREDYDNLRAESNGILTEGYEVSINLASNNENIGGSNRFIHEFYIAPQTEGLLIADTIPSNVADALAEEFDCLPFNRVTYPEDNLYSSGAVDAAGRVVPRRLGTVYATVRFFGHTQGQSDVETQDFSFPVNLCCGCSINWTNCGNPDPCERYCASPDETKMCMPGVLDGSNEIDCRTVYHNPGAVWGCVDEDGNAQQCNCDDDC